MAQNRQYEAVISPDLKEFNVVREKKAKTEKNGPTAS